MSETFNAVDHQYGLIGQNILEHGIEKGDRTGTGTLSTFGQHMRFDISDGKLPLLTTKKVFTSGIIHELIWMLSGDTNIRYLKENGVNIWDSWIDPSTAEYRDYTDSEIKEKLLKHYGVTQLTFKGATEQHRWMERHEDGSVHFAINGEDPLREAYRATFQKEPRALIAGDLPNVYGKQWRKHDDTKIVVRDDFFNGKYASKAPYPEYKEVGWFEQGDDGTEMSVITREIDQIGLMMDQLKNDPDSRRIILSPWNVGEIDQMALPPCHSFFQLWTRPLSIDERVTLAKVSNITVDKSLWIGLGGENEEEELHAFMTSLDIPERALSSQLYMRSSDVPLGLPFNLVQYSLLTHLFAETCNMITEEFIWVGGDVHVYRDQVDTFKEQLARESKNATAWVLLNPTRKDVREFTERDIKIFDYDSQPAMKYPAAAI